MSNYNQLMNNLSELKLLEIQNQIDVYIDAVNKGDLNIIDALHQMTNLELDAKSKRAMLACVKVANFPYEKEIKDFDFTYQPSINKQQVEDFTKLRFLEKNENILFLGTSGVGKTHLATAVGIEAAKHRTSTYFISCHDLILQLQKDKNENRLETNFVNLIK
jgi:DNA replication protein DnaC